MRFFSRKQTAEAPAAGHQVTKSQKITYRPRGIETVCPEAGSDQVRFYLRPAQALGDRLGDLPLITNSGEDQPTRLQWQFAIAVEAINTLDNYPLQAIVNVHGEDKWDFHRAAFLRALVAGLGDWLNKHQIKTKKGNPVDVLTQGWQGAANLAPASSSHLPVNAGLMEWHISGEIVAENPVNYLQPDVYRLYMDSFGSDWHSRNPIAGAVAQAREKVIKRLSARGFSVEHAVDVAMGVSRPDPQRSAATTPTAPQSDSKPQHADSPVEVAPIDKAPPKPAPSAPKTIKKPGIEMQVSGDATSNGPAATSASPTPTSLSLDQVLTVVQQRMSEGIITANKTGAIFHGTPNGPALIIPKGYDIIAQVLKADMADVEALAQREMLVPALSYPDVVYRLRRKGRGWAKIKACVLKSEVASAIFPEGLESNPDIKVE